MQAGNRFSAVAKTPKLKSEDEDIESIAQNSNDSYDDVHLFYSYVANFCVGGLGGGVVR